MVIKVKRIFLGCLLVGMVLQGVSAASEEEIVIVANSIDRGINSDFVEYLNQKRDVVLVHPEDIEEYTESTYVIILGGNKAPEGTGDIVNNVLTQAEKTSIAAEPCMVVTLNVWRDGQVVVVLAGPDREKTAASCEENKHSIGSLFDGTETVLQLVADHDVIAFLWPFPLLTSDEIAPHVPSPLPEDATKAPYIIPYPLEEPSWFFFIDDMPYVKYAHPVRYIFFGIETRQYTVYEEEWWPVLNGKSLWTESHAYWNESSWVYNPGLSKPQSSGVSFLRARLVHTESNGNNESKDKALVVNGWTLGDTHKEEMAEDEKGMKNALKNALLSVTTANTKVEFEQTLNKFAREMKDGSNLVIYITAHGGNRHVWIGNDILRAGEFESLLMNFEDGVKIHVIIDACCAGSFIEPLKGEADLVITSCAQDEVAPGDWDTFSDPNPGDKGSEFTSGFVEGLNFLLRDQKEVKDVKSIDKDFYVDYLELAFSAAVKNDVFAKLGFTHPLIWKPEFDPCDKILLTICQ